MLGTVRLYFSFNFQNYPQKTYKDEEAEAQREVIWPKSQASHWHGWDLRPGLPGVDISALFIMACSFIPKKKKS